MVTDNPRRLAETLGSGEEVHAHWGGRASDVHAKCRYEIERLRAELKDADDDFHALKAMFDKMRADRDRWRKIAEQLFLWLHPSPEDDSVYEAGVEAMTMYEQAVRGE